jgi:hypothetical protein
MNILQSIGAVLAGLVVVVLLSEGMDFALRSAGFFPPLDAGMSGMTEEKLMIAFGYRTLAGVAGGFVAAALAPGRAMTHALVLGLIGLGLSTLGAVAMWGIGPAWYPIALAVIALPAAWLGGWIQQMGREKAQA